jgi:integrase
LMGRPRPVVKAVPTDTVLGVLDAFLDWCQKHRAGRTYDWYRDYLESFARTVSAGLTIDCLKPFHVQQWLDANTGWISGKRGAVIAVQRAFNWAVRMGLIAANPVRSIEKPQAGRREHVIGDDQYATLLGLVRDCEFRDLLTLCWETGCRPEDALSVEARHVDLQNGCWAFPVQESKGKKHQRVVYLTDIGLAITRRLMLAHPTGPLLRNTDGLAWSPSALNCRFARLRLALGRAKLEEAGLMPPKLKRLTQAQRADAATRIAHDQAVSDRRRLIAEMARGQVPRYCLYTFRHSWCTHALERGVDAVTVAVLMGHRDTTMISRVYSHLMQRRDHLRDAIRKAAGA